MINFFPLLRLCLILPFLTDFLKAEEPVDFFAELTAKIKPSVVTISSTDRGGGAWGVGTGFVVRSDGVIASNFHVVGEHREFTVELSDGTECLPTEILAIDKVGIWFSFVSAEQTSLLPLGNSSLILPGQSVLSMGNPLGYGLSVSRESLPQSGNWNWVMVAPWCNSPFLLSRVAVAVLWSTGRGSNRCTHHQVGRSDGIWGAIAIPDCIDGRHQSVPIDQWFTIGMLDDDEWLRPLGEAGQRQASSRQVVWAKGLADA